MSDILQRTIASLPGLLAGVAGGGQGQGPGPSGPHIGPRGSGPGRGVTDVSNGMLSFIQGLCNGRSKYADEQLVKREVSLQKQKLSNPSQTTTQKRDSLARLLYCHLLGYDVSFAYIQAVKLAQQGAVLEKRVGYLMCAVFLDDTHELSMLLINTILKDLSSTNILEVCIALTAAGHLVSSEMIPSVLPSVCEKLKHSKEIIRRKAVLCLRAFVLKVPALASQLRPSLKVAITDKDPGVMWAALEVFHDLILNDASAYIDLVPALVDILEQVISRRLPSHFDYHTVPSPWLTITILKLFATLGKTDESVRKQISPILQDVLQRTEPSHAAGLAIIYEALVTIAVINADSSLMSLAAKCVSRFLSSKKINLRYIGIKVLSSIVQTDDRYALDHQTAVIDCLEHQDVTIQRTTLQLLCNMANPVNKQVICDRLLDYADRSTDQFGRTDIVAKILHIADRLSDDVVWYIDQVVRVLETNGDVVPNGTINRLIRIIKSGSPANKNPVTLAHCEHALKICWQKLKLETLCEPLMQVAVWTVGEYSHLDSTLTPDTITSCLVDWYRKSFSASARKWILSALCKQKHCIAEPEKVLEELRSISDPNDRPLQQRLHEFGMLCTISPEIREALSYRGANSQMDFSMSFLDNFVSEALEGGSLPYRTASLRLNQTTLQKSKDISSSIVYDSIVESSEESLSSLFFGVAAEKPSSAPSSAPSRESSETSSTGKREAGGLQMKNVKVVWGKDGLVKPATDWPRTNETERETLTSDDAGAAQKTADPNEIRKAEERKALADALFSGIDISAKKEEKMGVLAKNLVKPGADELNSDGRVAMETRLEERSISPDSIESNSDLELNANKFCDRTLISDSFTADFLTTNAVGSEESSVTTQQFLPSPSQRSVPRDVEIKSTENDSLMRIYLENKTLSKNLSNSWNCHSQPQSDYPDLFRCASDKQISCDNSAIEHSGSAGLHQSGSQMSELRKRSQNKLFDYDSAVRDNIVESENSYAKSFPAPSEVVSSVEDFAGSGSTVDPCFEVFQSDSVSVFCQKLYFLSHLQLKLTFLLKDLTVESDFDDATLAVVDSTEQFYKAEFVNDETHVGRVVLIRLSSDNRRAEVRLNVFPSGLGPVCPIKQFSVDLLLNLANKKERNTVSIPLHLVDFIRPCDCSLQEFAVSWTSLPRDLQRVSSCSTSVVESMARLLNVRCRLHIVEISGSECLFAGQILDSGSFKILLHAKLVADQTLTFVHLWIKSQNSNILDDLMSAIVTALRN